MRRSSSRKTTASNYVGSGEEMSNSPKKAYLGWKSGPQKNHDHFNITRLLILYTYDEQSNYLGSR